MNIASHSGYGHLSYLTFDNHVSRPTRIVQWGSRLPSLSFRFSQQDVDTLLYSRSYRRKKDADVTKERSVINHAQLDLPKTLSLEATSVPGFIQVGVFCKGPCVSKGTRYGPFRGKVVNTSEIKSFDDNTFMWEIFQDGCLSHFVDGRGSTGNWMSYVNCARHRREQNVVVVQSDGDIFFEVCCEIGIGDELLTWYSDEYVMYTGIPLTLRQAPREQTNESTSIPQGSSGFQCERCGKVFTYCYYREKHLKYTRCRDQGDREYPCHLCNRSFEKRDRLRIHILHVHERHRPHKCCLCGKSFSQSSSLNKHMRVHSGERPYKCVYCNKAFTASSILRTHLRQHSGEKPFKCKFCGKSFASHAAHDSHVRRTHQPQTGT